MNCEVVVLLGAPLEQARRYAEVLHLPFPVLADAEREVYHRYGLDKVAFLIQRTASLVVDRDGVIRYVKRATNPMTWLQESQEVLEFARSLATDG